MWLSDPILVLIKVLTVMHEILILHLSSQPHSVFHLNLSPTKTLITFFYSTLGGPEGPVRQEYLISCLETKSHLLEFNQKSATASQQSRQVLPFCPWLTRGADIRSSILLFNIQLFPELLASLTPISLQFSLHRS